MIKKTITYTNPFTEAEVTETHYFHISKADLVAMELEEHKDTYTDAEGNELTGMQAKIQRIVDSEDGKAILAETKDIIRRAYGIKDGERFVKTEETWKDFASSEAFSQLLFELCTDAEKAGEFMNGVVPKNLDQIAAEVKAQAEKTRVAEKLSTQDPTGLTTPTPEANTDQAVAPLPEPTGRAAEIINATAENPVTLTTDEVVAMDHNKMKEGLTEGRFKLSD